jgi:serine/threonine protein kinase/predicted ATPase
MDGATHSIGSYSILEPLGRGGMGVVYRAAHRDTGRLVALKTVQAPNEWALSGLRREIHVLARIRHPQVVRILDEGLHDGLPWYAMELLEGPTLQSYAASLHAWRRASARLAPPSEARATGGSELADAGHSSFRWWTASLAAVPAEAAPARPATAPGEPGPLRLAASGRLPEVLTLLRRLCAPLAFLHGEGVVHRDLKLENVLLRAASGERRAASEQPAAGAGLATRGSQLAAFPVLMDFGLVSQFGGTISREAVDVRLAASGSVATMAPEQIAGELVDARADLYALGCMLYELLTGRPPFVGPSPAAVIYGHLRERPLAPSELASGVPRQLDELVLRLLAKEPSERLGYAGDVATALEALGAATEPLAAAPQPRPYLYRPGFAGREAALDELRQQLSALEHGDAGLVLIGGESGAGKTRLALELTREAERRKLCVLAGECLPDAGAALQALKRPLQGIADRCRQGGVAETQRLLGHRGRLLALYEPALDGLPGQEHHPEPAELPAEAARLRLHSYLSETFAALAGEAPLLLLLDDLQWADELLLGWLGFLQQSRRTQRAPLLLLGTYRSEEVPEALQRLLQVQGVRRVLLSRLEEETVGRMVGGMLALSPAPRLFVRFLARQSEGNPLFVAEYLRAALAEGLLRRDSKGRWQMAEHSDRQAEARAYEALPLPGSLRALVARRLDGLSAEALRLVQAAAVAGRQAPLALVSRMAELEPRKLLDAVAEVLRRQVLEEPEAGALRFLHDKLREVAYESLAKEHRCELHAAAAEAIEALKPRDRDEHLAALGQHLEQAGSLARARDCYLAGARRARDRSASEEAERLYHAYLRLAQPPAPESVAARSELATDILAPAGRVPEAIQEQASALDEARALADCLAQGQAARGLGDLYRMSGRMDEARALLQQALASYREAGHRQGEGMALGSLAVVDQEQGHTDAARERSMQALRRYREIGDRRLEGRTLGTLANLHLAQGRFDEAAALYEQALDVAREMGDRRTEAYQLGNLAIYHQQIGRTQRAGALYDEALRIFGEIGDSRSAGIMLGNKAGLPHTEGRLDEAAELYEQALALHRLARARRSEAIALGNFALLRLAQGRVEEAAALCEQALELSREVGDRRLAGVALCSMANCKRRCGAALEEAEHLVLEAEAIARETGDRIQAGFCLCERGHLVLAHGSPARGLLEEAEALALALSLKAESELYQAIQRLRQAVDAQEAGLPLLRGERAEDLPAGLRRRLAETGPADRIERQSGEQREQPRTKRAKRERKRRL